MDATIQPTYKLTDHILDENFCPVARMRLLSAGMNENTRLFANEQVIGDKACLACGNCVDACPVISEKYGFVSLHNQRTSMALEHMVGEECRRCYHCIRSCPQVDKTIKEHAAAFRRGEKIIHILVALTIVLLAFSGMILSHYRDLLPGLEVKLLDYGHRIFGLVLMMLPILYLILDRKHMLRWLRRIFFWGRNERNWAEDFIKHLKEPKKNPQPYKGEFNTAQKAWYVFITVMIPFMSVTGLILLFGSDIAHSLFYVNTKLLHMITALFTDILLLIHIYLKYLRNWGIRIYDIIKTYSDKRHLNYFFLYQKKT